MHALVYRTIKAVNFNSARFETSSAISLVIFLLSNKNSNIYLLPFLFKREDTEKGDSAIIEARNSISWIVFWIWRRRSSGLCTFSIFGNKFQPLLSLHDLSYFSPD